MENKSKFDEVADYLIKAHDSIFKGSDYNLPLTENEANQIATYLKERWEFFKEKYLEKRKSIEDAVKSYKPEQILWMEYCKRVSEKAKNLKDEDRIRLIEFMKTKGLKIDSHGYHLKNRHSPTFDGIPYAFFALQIEETKDYERALKKLKEALK